MRKPSADSPPEKVAQPLGCEPEFSAPRSACVRPTALLLAPEAPYPAIGGGALRSASVVEYLGRHYALDLIVFREPGAPDPAAAVPPGLVREIHVIELPRHSKRPVARALRTTRRLLRAVPPLNDRFGGFEGAIRQFLDGRRYQLAVVEHFWCAGYRDTLAPHCERLWLDLHNIESALLGGCAEAENGPTAYALRRFRTACLDLERHWFPRFDLLLTASEPDARRAQEIAPGCRPSVYPNTIPCIPLPRTGEEEAIVFSGNLGYQPNISAIRFFRNRIWPSLRERWPGLEWRLIGRNSHAVAGLLAGDPRIRLLGPVEDAVSALASANVAVVPMLAGSGTRVKILEAWAAGRAVVSTALGAEGLPVRSGEHLLSADTPGDFAAAVSSLLESKQLRDRIGAAGRELYLTQFTWETAWARLRALGI
jgi:polysaccharide biosynthesis protein PslH